MLLWLPNISTAEETSRWIWVASGDVYSYYVDIQTPELLSDGKILGFWERVTSIYGGQSDSKYLVGLGTWKILRDQYVWTDSNGRKRNTRSDRSITLIKPESITEKAVNAILDKLGKKPLFGHKEHNWEWIYSDDYRSYQLCTNTYDKVDSDVLVYVKSTNPQTNASFIRFYLVSLDTHEVEDDLRKDLVLSPESLAEAIFNKTAALVK